MRPYELTYSDDIELINEYCLTGNQKAATAFVRKYQSFVYSVAYRWLHNHEDSQDAAQEVFIKAFNNIQNFKKKSSLKTWLYRITVNVCSNMLRKKKLLSFFGKDDLNEHLNIPDHSISPDEEFENKEFQEKFLKILSKLPEKQRETFALRYFDEMSYEEISELLGTSIGGLKANYFQAVKKIAKMLKYEQKFENK